MQASRFLRPGLLVAIEVNPGENWPFTIGYVSDDRQSITCEFLLEKNRHASIETGAELTLTYSAEDGIYRFRGKVVKVTQDPLQISFSLIDNVEHTQRREFFRLIRPMVRARYRPIGGPEDIFDAELIEAPVKDLSGNGIALIIPKEDELPSGMPLVMEIELMSGRQINLIGEVIRCIPNDPVVGKSLLCVHFSVIEERDRDRIIGHLFREQLDRAGRKRRMHKQG
ncbi:MAG: PilZ domain-containing protein [Firmicutes bacterium]|nr:PilZ domain-containing protein [Bacillota bacterium]